MDASLCERYNRLSKQFHPPLKKNQMNSCHYFQQTAILVFFCGCNLAFSVECDEAVVEINNQML